MLVERVASLHPQLVQCERELDSDFFMNSVNLKNEMTALLYMVPALSKTAINCNFIDKLSQRIKQMMTALLLGP